MRGRTALQIVLLSVAFALATALFGWWAVPALGGVWGVVARDEERPALRVCFAAGLGWVLLLAWTATQGPIFELARRAAGVMGTPSVALFALTVMFPMVLAWGAAVVVGTLKR